MKTLDLGHLEFILQIHDLIERVVRLNDTARARSLQERFDRLAAPFLDSDGPGRTMLLRRIHNDKTFIRLSAFPEAEANLRISVSTIREPTVDYRWIDDEILRAQLVADNLVMEHDVLTAVNVACGVRRRFVEFCLGANLQLEPLLEYFFKRSGRQQPVAPNSKYPSHSSRIYEFFTIFKPDGKGPDKRFHHYRRVEAIRVIRNRTLHRRPVPIGESDELKALSRYNKWGWSGLVGGSEVEQAVYAAFTRESDYAGVRDTLTFVSDTIRQDIGL